jgi:hypothetical protein
MGFLFCKALNDDINQICAELRNSDDVKSKLVVMCFAGDTYIMGPPTAALTTVPKVSKAAYDELDLVAQCAKSAGYIPAGA